MVSSLLFFYAALTVRVAWSYQLSGSCERHRVSTVVTAHKYAGDLSRPLQLRGAVLCLMEAYFNNKLYSNARRRTRKSNRKECTWDVTTSRLFILLPECQRSAYLSTRLTEIRMFCDAKAPPKIGNVVVSRVRLLKILEKYSNTTESVRELTYEHLKNDFKLFNNTEISTSIIIIDTSLP